ncbi:MAG: leucyl/phenylalanyl-tRNA--protein transferase [Gammaproteobacteria bacterium]|nr:leucyl/phenylalanyl-tRNA--protein transferase [Gammaproteobacteria bacterium]MYD81648.1 leucyl/phenylalanyl-tRNA--protein transferase [Gammaproteobacteria bacterium]
MAIGGDLSSSRLLDAYSKGIFPWFDNDEQPVMWWSPDPRCILYPHSFHMSRSLGKWCRKHELIATIDQDFDRVIEHCASPRQYEESTWITPSMKHAFSVLHQEGYAHSLEIRFERSLVGGIYGISLGRHFYGESMFSLMTNGSKVALMALCQLLAQREFEFVDCQIPTAHLISQGAVIIDRIQFLKLIEENRTESTTRGPWEIPPFQVLPNAQVA